MMNNAIGMVKSFTADAEVVKRRIVAFGGQDYHTVTATGPTNLLGVSGIRGAKPGEVLDVYMSDTQDLEYGELISFGDYVTAGPDGRAVVASPAADVTMEVIGRAMETGPEGAICKVLICPMQITG